MELQENNVERSPFLNTLKKKISIFTNFRNWLLKGNAFDLAIGVMIGTVTSALLMSLLQDIILPPISLITGSSYENWFYVLRYPNETVHYVSIYSKDLK